MAAVAFYDFYDIRLSYHLGSQSRAREIESLKTEARRRGEEEQEKEEGVVSPRVELDLLSSLLFLSRSRSFS